MHPLRAVCALIAVGSFAAPARAAGQTEREPTPELNPPPPAVPRDALHFGRDSVTAAPGETYPAGRFHRFLLGDLHRDLWTIAFTVPILDLDSVGGGLSVVEVSGGKQTLGLRFEGRDGLPYQFRSIVKSPSRILPDAADGTLVEDAVNDAMASQFPLSAMVVAELLNAADILVARPRPVVMPDDERLGEYREAFAGRMGWIEARPDEREGDRPGWEGSSKITGTDELYEQLREEPSSYVDARALLRARLIDILVGDRDRHSDQWRWASFEDEEGRLRWEPIPRDRDWALARIDGALPWLAGFYFPRYTGFDAEYPDVVAMAWSGQEVDRRLLAGLDGHDFVEAARDLRAAFSDEVLEGAVGVLPPPYQEAVGASLLEALTLRRDTMEEWARDYYEMLAGWVDVYATDEQDSVVVSPGEDGGMRVQVFSVEDAEERGVLGIYDRTFLPAETREVRVYLFDDDDRVMVAGPDPLPISIRLIGGGDEDVYVDRTSGRSIVLYDDEGGNTVELGPRAVVTSDALLVQDSIRTAYALWNSRDWGSAVVPRPELRYDSDIGLFAGFGVSRRTYAWGFRPYRSRASLSVLNGFSSEQWIVDAELDRPLGHGGWRLVTSLDAFTDRPTWLFGIGNDVEKREDTRSYRSFRSEVTGALALHFRADTSWMGFVGLEAARLSAVEPGASGFDELRPYGTGDFSQAGLRFGARVDTRDDHRLPTSGFRAELRGSVFPAVLDAEDAFGTAHVEVGGVLSAPLPTEPALTLRAVGEQVWGRTPYHELPALGGSATLPGFVRQRFVGRSAAAGAALLRLKVWEPSVLGDLDIGVHGLATSGRVWIEDDPSDRWHSAYGGGLWLRSHAIDRVVSVTAVSGETLRVYLDFGLIF